MKTAPSFDRRPLAFHQVCAIARSALQSNPTINDSEWKALTKDIAARQGYDEPAGDMLALALTNVEAALKRQRPVVRLQATRADAPAPLTRAEASAVLARLGAHIKAIPELPSTADRLLTAQARGRAARFVAQEIQASIDRCDALERAVKAGSV